MASLNSLFFKSVFRNRSNLKSFQDYDEDKVNLCLMTKSDENNKEESVRKKWYINSGCSKHMTGDVSKFTTISPKKSGHVIYGDNNNGKWKCCTTVYDPPIRDWTFDSTFTDPNRLPPGAPFVYYITFTGFQRVNP